MGFSFRSLTSWLPAVVSPVAAVATVAKKVAPKTKVTDLIATASPVTVPQVKNKTIKNVATTGYSVAAMVGGGMAGAQALAGMGAAGATAGGAGGALGSKVAIEQGAPYLNEFGSVGTPGDPITWEGTPEYSALAESSVSPDSPWSVTNIAGAAGRIIGKIKRGTPGTPAGSAQGSAAGGTGFFPANPLYNMNTYLPWIIGGGALLIALFAVARMRR